MSFSASSTGGEYYHKLTVNEMSSHTHGTETNLSVHPQGDGTDGRAIVPYKNGSSQTGSCVIVYNTGGNGSHNNIQPYQTVYYWRRTA